MFAFRPRLQAQGAAKGGLGRLLLVQAEQQTTARRMGGDGRTVATIITVNVFVAMVTLPLWLGLAL